MLEAPRSPAGTRGEDMLKLFTTLGLPLKTQPFSLKIKKGEYINKSLKRHFRPYCMERSPTVVTGVLCQTSAVVSKTEKYISWGECTYFTFIL